MQSQKLLVIVSIVCLFVGASGAAMAEGCGDGILQNETFGNLTIRNERNCTITSSTIQGNLRVINSDNVLLLNNKIRGLLLVKDGGVANVIANTVLSGRIVVEDNDVANVIENETLPNKIESGQGDIRVIGNTEALVQKNIAAKNLVCKENTVLSSFLNIAGNKLDCE